MLWPTLRATGPILAAFAVLSAGCTSAPPVQEMSDARQAIASASGADARQHAPELLAEAERLIAVAEAQIRDEAYGRARTNALRAKSRALRALDRATVAADASAD